MLSQACHGLLHHNRCQLGCESFWCNYGAFVSYNLVLKLQKDLIVCIVPSVKLKPYDLSNIDVKGKPRMSSILHKVMFKVEGLCSCWGVV